MNQEQKNRVLDRINRIKSNTTSKKEEPSKKIIKENVTPGFDVNDPKSVENAIMNILNTKPVILTDAKMPQLIAEMERKFGKDK